MVICRDSLHCKAHSYTITMHESRIANCKSRDQRGCFYWYMSLVKLIDVTELRFGIRQHRPLIVSAKKSQDQYCFAQLPLNTRTHAVSFIATFTVRHMNTLGANIQITSAHARPTIDLSINMCDEYAIVDYRINR